MDLQVVKSKEEILKERQIRKQSKKIKKNAIPAQNDHTTCKEPDLSNKSSLLPGKREDTMKQESAQDLENSKTSEYAEDSKHPLSKAELKKQRRELQERQRNAKLQNIKISENSSKNAVKTDNQVSNTCSARMEAESKIELELKSTMIVLETIKKIPYFSHLPQYPTKIPDAEHLPAPIKKLGEEIHSRSVTGSDSLRLALLTAYRETLDLYEAPREVDLSKDLEAKLSSYVKFLEHCRPLVPSMISLIKNLKKHICQIHKENDTESIAKNKLFQVIDEFIKNMNLDKEAIATFAKKKIYNNDVIITYSWSSLICHILIKAWRDGTFFQVIVIDSHPMLQGRMLLKHLLAEGIQCTYVLVTGAAYVMPQANKVMLGASALLADGSVMSHVGTAQVALLAHVYNVPVLVCCETYNFCECVQTDAIVYNELGDPSLLINPAVNKIEEKLYPVNIQYDVTPPSLVTAVITEKEILPCTSVPVVLRVQYGDSV